MKNGESAYSTEDTSVRHGMKHSSDTALTVAASRSRTTKKGDLRPSDSKSSLLKRLSRSLTACPRKIALLAFGLTSEYGYALVSLLTYDSIKAAGFGICQRFLRNTTSGMESHGWISFYSDRRAFCEYVRAPLSHLLAPAYALLRLSVRYRICSLSLRSFRFPISSLFALLGILK